LTIAEVEVAYLPAFEDARRVLVVSYTSSSSPGTLGYCVVVRSGCSVGDHYHDRREELIILIDGRAEFRLLDRRAGSATRGCWNRFEVSRPGSCVRVPAGVAHTVTAIAGPLV